MRLLTICLLVLLSLGAQAQTLEEAIGWALVNNRDLAITRQEMGIALDKSAYAAGTRPSISFSATPVQVTRMELGNPTMQFQTRYDLTDHLRIDLNIPITMDSIKVKPAISYSRPLFTPKEADRPENPSTPQQTVLLAEQRLVLDVASAYLRLIKQEDALALRQAELEIAQSKLDRARQLERPEVEILKADSDLDAARQKVEDGITALRSAQGDLADLMGYRGEISLVREMEYHPLQTELQDWLDLGVGRHTQVVDARYRLGLAQANLHDYLADHGWDVKLTGTYQERVTQGVAQNEFRASITVNKSLYPTDPNRQRELELALTKAEISLEQALLRANRDIETAYLKVTNAENRITTLGERLTEAYEGLVREERRVLAGLSTELARAEVEVMVRGIEMDLLHAKYDHLLAVWELFRVSGLTIPWQSELIK